MLGDTTQAGNPNSSTKVAVGLGWGMGAGFAPGPRQRNPGEWSPCGPRKPPPEELTIYVTL